MGHGSTSQTSTNVVRGGSRGSVPLGTAGMRRRVPSGPNPSSRSRVSQNVMNFYTDDSPGIKIPPVVVVVMSLCFIAFVTILHVVGKIRG